MIPILVLQSAKLVKLLKLKVIPSNDVIGKASAYITMKSVGHCFASLTLQKEKYQRVKVTLLEITNIILGTDFLMLH